MTRLFKRLQTEQDFQEFAKSYVNAYPGIGMTAEQGAQRLFEISQTDKASEFIAAVENETLVGGMRLIDYHMNYFGQMILAGGVGGVAVDLLHKKKGIAKDLIVYYLDHFLKKGASLAFLYPFRPDFYYKMGFGYGTKMNQYSFSPLSLPKRDFPGELVYVTPEHLPELRSFYERLTLSKHGYCYKSNWEYEGLLKYSAAPKMMVAYAEQGTIKGYLAFGFRKAHDSNFVKNNILIREWLWETREAFDGLCHFLRTQADQINRVIFNTQDPEFHWVLSDVRNTTDNIFAGVYHESNTSGVGVMYRIISVQRFIETVSSRNFNGVSLNVCFDVQDTLRPENHGRHHVRFEAGKVSNCEDAQDAVVVSIDIADLSALFMGSVDVKTLYNMGKINVTPNDMDKLHQAFYTPVKPECISLF